ncbi:MAG TPA: hypothetical protein VER32_12695, partial [Pyrinomonadaceae bacterium]|nr:hypothetical protein [Pyrinomonadaceae bacterium]
MNRRPSPRRPRAPRNVARLFVRPNLSHPNFIRSLRNVTRPLVALVLVSSLAGLTRTAAADTAAGPRALVLGELSAAGGVRLDGRAATSGVTVFSGSAVETGETSGAVVSLGALGRVELLPRTSVRLDFTASRVAARLEAGGVRLSTTAGVAASVSTADAEVFNDGRRPGLFLVDATCGATVVAARSAGVELREAAGPPRALAAGESVAAGRGAHAAACADALEVARASAQGDDDDDDDD